MDFEGKFDTPIQPATFDPLGRSNTVYGGRRHPLLILQLAFGSGGVVERCVEDGFDGLRFL